MAKAKLTSKQKTAIAKLKSKLNKLEERRKRMNKHRSKLLKDIKKIDKRAWTIENNKWKRITRVESVSEAMNENINPNIQNTRYTNKYMVNYQVFLQKYTKRKVPARPEWHHTKQIILKGTEFENEADIEARAPIKIEEHWQQIRISSEDTEIPFKTFDFEYEDRFQPENMKQWLVIESVHNVTNTENPNHLPALGKTWKSSLREALNTHDYNLRDGVCWLDYLEQKICAQSGFKFLTRPILEKQLFTMFGIKTGFSTEQIVRWIRIYNYKISVIALNANYELTKKYAPSQYYKNKNRHDGIVLCYQLTNRHIHPIENPTLFKSFLKGDLKSLRDWDKLEAKWKSDHRTNYQNFSYFAHSIHDYCMEYKLYQTACKCYTEISKLDMTNIIANISSFVGTNEMQTSNLLAGTYKQEKDVIYFSKKTLNFGDLMLAIMKQTQYKPEHIRPQTNSFIHPISHQLYVQTDNFLDRMEIANACKETYKTLNFNFCNQSISSMSRTIFENLFGKIRKSTHTNVAIELLDDYATMPISTTCDTTKHNDDDRVHFHFDKRICYASVATDILKNEYLPIFTIYDNIVPYKSKKNPIFECGLYLINEFVIDKYHLRMQTQWMPHFEVKYLIEKGYITQKHIALQYISSLRLKGEILSQYVEYLFDMYPKSIANPLWHHFYGSFNTKRKRENIAFITNEINEAICYYTNNRDSVSFSKLSDGSWLVEKKINERLMIDNCGLYSCVLGGGHIKLFDMLESLPFQMYMCLEGVRTDSVYVSYPLKKRIRSAISSWEKKFCVVRGEDASSNPLRQQEKTPYRVEDNWNIPNPSCVLRLAKVKLERYDLGFIKPQVFDKNADYSDKNILVQGCAGSFKTGVLIDNYKKWKNANFECKASAFTNVAKENLIKRGIAKDDGCTLHAMLGLGYNSDFIKATTNKLDKILVDEYSMLDEELYVCLNRKVNNVKSDNFNIQLYGDYNQCGAVSDKVRHKLHKTQFLKQLLGKDGLVLNKKYEIMYDSEGNRIEPRCDDEIMKLYRYVKKHRRLPEYLFFDTNYDFLWIDETIAKHNIMMCKNRTTRRDGISVDVLNKRYREKIAIGSVVICNKNNKNLDFWNGERYVVVGMDSSEYYQVRKWEPNPNEPTPTEIRNIPRGYVTHAHAETIYKHQGLTLYDKYFIFQPHLMALEEFITAITRAKKITQIRLTNKRHLMRWTNWPEDTKGFYSIYDKKYYNIDTLSKSNAYHLYMLVCGNDAYIGFSVDSSKRKIQHELKKDCACKQFDFKKTRLILLGEFTAFTQKQCEIIENAFIQDYDKFSDYNIVNVRGNNNKVDTSKKSKIKRTKKRDKVDTSKKFQILENTKECYFEITAQLNAKRVLKRYKRRGRDVVYAEMVQLRDKLIAEHFKNL